MKIGTFRPHCCQVLREDKGAHAVIGVLFWLLLALTAAIYAPGLTGPFLFDDKPHLSALGLHGGIDDLQSFWAYINTGYAGPTGRPVALASFLLDANFWPAPARPFKYTNVCIHLLNGCLLFLVSLQILRLRSPRLRIDSTSLVAGLLAVAVWLLHPYLVSTTLYVVQRMAMLSTLFVLIALAIWVPARARIARHKTSSYLWMTFALAVPGSLAVLSKENGVLLPLLILVIEVTIMRAAALPGLNNTWKTFFLYLPCIIVVAYLVYYPTKGGWLDPYTHRSFSPLERLITEPRIIMDYLRHWFLPRLYTSGVFQDHVQVSRGLFSPPGTAVALFSVIALVVLAMKTRKKYPLASMALLYFFSSQLIESTTLPLDLKFEHRVYLGTGFLFLPVFHSLLSRYDKRLMLAPLAMIVVLLGAMCWQNTRLWSDYSSMVRVWSQQAPESSRAQIERTNSLYKEGAPGKALANINQAAERMPNEFYLRVNQLIIQCKLDQNAADTRDDLGKLAEEVEYAPIWFEGMKELMNELIRRNCPGATPGDFSEILDDLISQYLPHRKNTLGYAHLSYLKGVTALKRGNPGIAKEAFAESFSARKPPGKLMKAAAHLATSGDYSTALRYAKKARAIVRDEQLRGRARLTAPRLSDIEHFIKVVEEDIRKNDGAQRGHTRQERGLNSGRYSPAP